MAELSTLAARARIGVPVPGAAKAGASPVAQALDQVSPEKPAPTTIHVHAP